MTKKEIIRRLIVEDYEVPAGRCWGCCQENCLSSIHPCKCSCHQLTETLYRVILNDKIVKADFINKPDLGEVYEKFLSIKNIKAHFRTKRRELLKAFYKEIAKNKMQEAEELKRIYSLLEK